MIAGTRTVRPDQAAAPIPWAAFAWFAALIVICYAPVLYSLVRQWATDDDMGHGFFVPLVAGYIVWQRRAELAAVVPAPNWWGLALVLWGGAQLYVATLGAELFLARTSFVITIFGTVVFLGGMPLLRAILFPLALLFLMVPIPAIIYNQITFPLQLFASRVAESSLALLGIPVLREGNILELANQRLSVVEACSGIRSLLTLTFLSLVYAYFFDSKVWMRGVLLVATVPIAITANAARVTITGILTEYDPDLAEGVFHTAEGWVIFMVALAMLVATHAVINRIYGAVHARR
jgi:exosortase